MRLVDNTEIVSELIKKVIEHISEAEVAMNDARIKAKHSDYCVEPIEYACGRINSLKQKIVGGFWVVNL